MKTKTNRYIWRTAWLLAAVLISGGLVRLAAAHGGGTPQLISQTAGPFLLSVWTVPEPITEGEVHFVVALAEPSDNARSGVVVLDAIVDMVLESLDSGERIVTAATHEQSDNKFFYEASVQLPESGRWRATLNASKDGQVGTAAFEFDVARPPLNINWGLIGGAAIVLLAVIWFIWQAREGKRTGTPAAERA